MIATFGAAMVGALFSSDAWASVTFAASEVREPGRNLPRALAIGAGSVIVLYIFTNIAYLCELPALRPTEPHLMSIAGADNDRVATATMQMVWDSSGAVITALLVMVSTFGCANGFILTGARVIYAMAHDGVFARAAGKLNRSGAPAVALILQGLWSGLLALSGTYSELLDYVIFAQLLFYALTVGAVFILRKKKPDVPRPYRVGTSSCAGSLYCFSHCPNAGLTIDETALYVPWFADRIERSAGLRDDRTSVHH